VSGLLVLSVVESAPQTLVCAVIYASTKDRIDSTTTVHVFVDIDGLPQASNKQASTNVTYVEFFEVENLVRYVDGSSERVTANVNSVAVFAEWEENIRQRRRWLVTIIMVTIVIVVLALTRT